jgi:hypothetical protein
MEQALSLGWLDLVASQDLTVTHSESLRRVLVFLGTVAAVIGLAGLSSRSASLAFHGLGCGG